MIRVGFVLGELNDGWLGGLNYYRSLFSALDLLSNSVVHPVVFLATGDSEAPSIGSRTAEIVRSDLFNSKTLKGTLWRGLGGLYGHSNFVSHRLLEALLRDHGVDVLSHYSDLRADSGIKTIGWVPDFQHTHLPNLFAARDRRVRDRSYAAMATGCDRLVLSSANAQQDLSRFAPQGIAKSRVLHFVPAVDAGYERVSREDLERKYEFGGDYFFLPSQFWVHKNHRVVVDALLECRKLGVHPLVLASGKGHDYRNPGYFDGLMNTVAQLGLDKSFRHLGVIPYEDLLALMRYSLATVSPSLFEGWSTTVEEAKILDKTIILSDIPVHREQDPRRGIYFPPQDSAELARALTSVLRGADSPHTERSSSLRRDEYLAARTQFASKYVEIVAELALEM